MARCKRTQINCGRNGIIYWCDSHFRKLRKIFQKFLKEFAKISMIFARNDCLPDFPFASFYNERTLASALIPALRAIAKSQYVMTEVPINRRNQNLGFIDYVVCTNVGFLLIEAKFPIPPKRFGACVNEGLDQTIGINPSILNYYNPAFRILLVIKSLFTDCDDDIDIESECCYYCESFSDIVDQRVTRLAPPNNNPPKFCAHWRIPNYTEYEIEDECYPAVLFYGCVLR